MTQLEILQMIGDVITEIDVGRGSLLPDDRNRRQLDDLRILLDDRQRQLSRATFDDNTQQFQDAAQGLQAINKQIQGNIQSVDDIQATLDNVSKFLSAVTTLISTIGPFV